MLCVVLLGHLYAITATTERRGSAVFTVQWSTERLCWQKTGHGLDRRRISYTKDEPSVALKRDSATEMSNDWTKRIPRGRGRKGRWAVSGWLRVWGAWEAVINDMTDIEANSFEGPGTLHRSSTPVRVITAYPMQMGWYLYLNKYCITKSMNVIHF